MILVGGFKSKAILNVSPAAGKVAAVMVICAEELKHRAVNRASNIRLIGWLIIEKMYDYARAASAAHEKILFVYGFKGTPDFLAKNAQGEICPTISKKIIQYLQRL